MRNAGTANSENWNNLFDCFSFGVKSSHFQNLSLINNRQRAFLPFVGSVFGGGVAHVFSLRPRKQVTRINARSIVAFVANKQITRKLSIVEFVGKSVRLPVDHSPRLCLPKLPVSVRSFCASPNPALSKLGTMWRKRAFLVHFFPKSFQVSHKQKTSTNLEVNPARESGNEKGGCKNWISLILSADSMPFRNINQSA
jgi:hypothetical protein